VPIPSAWSAGRLGSLAAILIGKIAKLDWQSLTRWCHKRSMGHLGVEEPAMRIGYTFSSSYSGFSVRLLLFIGKGPSLVVLFVIKMLAVPRLALLGLGQKLIMMIFKACLNAWTNLVRTRSCNTSFSWRIGALLTSKSLGGLLHHI
jgi:hypothetical protein